MNDFEFTPDLKAKFLAKVGAGSQVTLREAKNGGDKSVTVSSAEKAILYKFYNVFPRMSVKRAAEKGETVEFSFRLFPTGSLIDLKINHPKQEGDETRIYFKRNIFYPEPNDYWFIYERDGFPWIGFLKEEEFSALNNAASIDIQNGMDAAGEEEYQTALNNPPKGKSSYLQSAYRRDPAVAFEALKKCGYVCELLPTYETFESKATGKPYLEAHHLLPIFEQRNFPEYNLDVVENICVLNPYAHKMLHHAPKAVILPHVTRLFEQRKPFFKALGVTLDRVMESYE